MLFRSQESFEGKPKELGIGDLNEEMKTFDIEIEREFDPSLDPIGMNNDEGSIEEIKCRLRKQSSRSNCGNSIEPHISQRIQSNISLIKCKAVYLSPSSNLRSDAIFIATADGNLYLYTLECNYLDATSQCLSYNTKAGTVELLERSFMANKQFHLIGLKSWEFSAKIVNISFEKIFNPNKEWSKKKRRTNSFHGSVDNSLNDLLICVGLGNQKMSIFTFENQTPNEIVINKSLNEISIIGLQFNVFVSIK